MKNSSWNHFNLDQEVGSDDPINNVMSSEKWDVYDDNVYSAWIVIC